MLPVHLKTTHLKNESYFAIPISEEDYVNLRDGFAKTPNQIPEKFKHLNIVTFGDPLKGIDKELEIFIDEKLIKDRWINKNNFFTSNPLSKEDKRYSVQTNIAPSNFLKEVAKFNGCDYLVIYLENKKITDIKYEYTKTIRFVREGYTNKY